MTPFEVTMTSISAAALISFWAGYSPLGLLAAIWGSRPKIGGTKTTPDAEPSADALGLDPKDQRLPLLNMLFVVRKQVNDKDCKDHLDWVSAKIVAMEPEQPK